MSPGRTILVSEYQTKVSIHEPSIFSSFNSTELGGGLSNFRNEISDPSDLFSFSHIRNATRLEDSRLGALRMASEHGLRATVDEQVSHWQQLVPSMGQAVGREENSEPKDLPQPRIGIGLPMSYIFAT